jgi:glucose/arabinose dehydrogenase
VRRLLLLVAAMALARPVDAAIDLQLVASNVPYVVGIERAAGGAPGRLFLVSQDGVIRIFDGSQVLATAFLDISGLVTFDGEQGLLGLAFDPNYASNGFFYVNYIDRARPQLQSGDTVIARYHVSADPNVADPNSATVVLTQTQPYQNHNGGQLRFGPDGFLYIALGDGGSGGDPENRAQNLSTLLGKLLRIDVTSASPYAVPAGNPFVGTVGARPEIRAYGLRNPWRVSFDRMTGDLWVADVGQNLWEEVNLQPAGNGGANYGWRLMEATHCYNPQTHCNPGTLTLPVMEYSHSLGCSVTGGFRYRGSALPAYVGTYFFSDYCSGRIWGAAFSGGAWRATQLLAPGLNVATFGEDAAGELYVGSYAQLGALYRIVSSAASRHVITVSKAGTGGGRVGTAPLVVECGSVCAAEVAAGTTLQLTAAASPGSTFAGWSGDPDCSDANVTLSVDRTCTATFNIGFTDDPLSPGTIVKAVHVTELRDRIDVLRLDAGLAPFAWSVPAPAAGGTIRAVQITEMRTALIPVFAAQSVAPPAYTDPSLAAGAPVRAVHVTDLRNAVLLLE